MDAPSWLDARLVEDILRESEEDDLIKVSRIIVRSATSKGDSYMSDVYRVDVEFSRICNEHGIAESKSIIAKVALQGTPHGRMVAEIGCYDTELAMMTDTLPKMNQFLAELNIASFTPRLLKAQNDTPIHLIMEDLVSEGYHVADRRAGLDLEHCLLVMRNLAVFHASSVALAEKDFEAVGTYYRGSIHKDHPIRLSQFYKISANAFATEVAKWSELNPEITRKLPKLCEVLFEKGLEAVSFRDDDFNVLNRGDCNTSNIMFRYNAEHKPVGLKFVDFQLSFYGSPAVDILQFLSTSPRDDIRVHKRELLLREYHISLTRTMAQLRCATKTPSFEKLQMILKNRGVFEVFTSIVLLPLTLIDNNENRSGDELIKEDGTYENPGYRNKLYRKVMIRLLPFYDSMGLLDV